MTQTDHKVLVAMSGGVDSSVAAQLLKEQGWDCIGCTMRLYQNEEAELPEGSCCSLEDAADARSVARRLRIPYYVFNFSDGFRTCVMERFVRAYENGQTPNPCIDCNRYLKFDKLFQRMKELSCSHLATGHYARIGYDEASGRFLLKKAADRSKDQSYVLYTMTQEQLRHTLFPLGQWTKQEVRARAERQGFVNARKPDSQDICFVPAGSYGDFIRRYTAKSYPEGDFVDEDGRVLGRHRGIIHYTIGQRRGLGISAGRALYVSAIDPSANTVTLGPESRLYTQTLTAGDVNMIAVPFLEKPARLKVRLRYRQTESWAMVTQPDADTLQVRFEVPQRTAARGQALVLYDGDVVVGGGTIK